MAYDDDDMNRKQNVSAPARPPSNPSFQLKASVQTYELSVPDLQKLLASQLGVPEERITITAREKVISSDPIDRFPEVYGFGGLTITVKNKYRRRHARC